MAQTLDYWPAGATATMSVTYTQANVAGGAIVCEIVPAGGAEFILGPGVAVNSGTNTVLVETLAAAGGSPITTHISIGSGAGTNGSWSPGLVSVSNATSASPTGVGWPAIISGTQALRIRQSAAGAQNDTFTIRINIRCKGALPTVSHANSTNPANVSVTSGAESFTTD